MYTSLGATVNLLVVRKLDCSGFTLQARLHSAGATGYSNPYIGTYIHIYIYTQETMSSFFPEPC